MTTKSYHTKPPKDLTAQESAARGLWSGDWQTWPSWVLDVWWSARIADRPRTRYGYGPPRKPVP